MQLPHPIRWKMAVLLTISLLALLPGCLAGKTRTVYVPDGKEQRTSAPTKVKKPFAQDPFGKWVQSDEDTTVPEGWYFVPPPKVAPK